MPRREQGDSIWSWGDHGACMGVWLEKGWCGFRGGPRDKMDCSVCGISRVRFKIRGRLDSVIGAEMDRSFQWCWRRILGARGRWTYEMPMLDKVLWLRNCCLVPTSVESAGVTGPALRRDLRVFLALVTSMVCFVKCTLGQASLPYRKLSCIAWSCWWLREQEVTFFQHCWQTREAANNGQELTQPLATAHAPRNVRNAF